VLVRSVRGFKQDNCLDLAAALTYWSLLALFPAAIVVVALVGVVVTSEAAVATITDIVEELSPDQVAAAVTDRLREVAGGRTAAGVLLSFGLLGALWTASAYLRSFTRAANTIYGVAEGRPIYRLLPQQLLLTVATLILAATVVFGLVVSGPIAEAVGGALGWERTVLTLWHTAKWPVLVLIAGALLSLLFWLAPNVRQPRFRWLTVGGAVALLVWIVLSMGFGFYVANFGAYDATYGALGAIIVFLVWMFLSNCAILLGVEINAQLQRGRRLQAGQVADADEPALPPRMPA
jgi:membrane protein